VRSTPALRHALRRCSLLCAGALCFHTALSVPLHAQQPKGSATKGSATRDDLTVTTTWLAAHLHDPDLVILHVGDPAQFGAKHIPGARLATLEDVSISDHSGNGLMLEMPAAQLLHDDLAKLGISNSSHVVVYYAQEWVTPATRVMFTLDYAGLGDHTSLLDAGMEGWASDGHPLSNDVTPTHVGKLSPLTIRPIVVNASYVHDHIAKPGVSIVDGRDASFYDGVRAGGRGDQRAGHIPSAKSVPFTEITDDRVKLRSADELAAIFAKAGVQPKDTVVGYCHIGQQATGMLFAARLLGHPVLLYDGSFEDWSRHTDFGVELSNAKGKP
jgi:thiosulfate/3-mercaptopyruvate sulfurtransferase